LSVWRFLRWYGSPWPRSPLLHNRIVVGLVLAMALMAVAAFGYLRGTGLRAGGEPAGLEARLARAARSFAIPRAARERANPVAASAGAIAAGLTHYADHCAVCHANDGSGETDFGNGMYPPPPDMRLDATQQLTDGELFYIIENGVRFTGMPAFASEHAGGEEETWQLVHFIRRLPALTDAELERMRDLNPRSAEEIRQEFEEERFLRGEP
jgi:mono/diheme cytochrome c family protein